ncbi:MAG: EamA family transporter [Zoogloeaceae bacterium]|jgi:drug/metabolite transporter (DMT)-like permease|nr:EamA family transporter [Zoogloeaceae bacterium]
MTALPSSSRFSPGLIVLMLAVALFWGLNWPVMKVAVRELPPLGFRGVALALGGLCLLAIARVSGKPVLPPPGKWKVLSWLSLTNILAWNALSIYAILRLPSGRAALLGYTMPIWSLLLSALWLHEKLSARRIAGLVLGALGVLAMLHAELTHLAGAPVGVLLMLAGAISWALGVVSIKRFPVPMSPVTFSGWLMLLGGVPLSLASLFLEWPQWHVPSHVGLWCFAYNVFITMTFCYWAWNLLVLRLPVAISSLSSLLVPLIGVASGMVLLGERPGVAEYLGAAFILGAVATVVVPGRKR